VLLYEDIVCSVIEGTLHFAHVSYWIGFIYVCLEALSVGYWSCGDMPGVPGGIRLVIEGAGDHSCQQGAAVIHITCDIHYIWAGGEMLLLYKKVPIISSHLPSLFCPSSLLSFFMFCYCTFVFPHVYVLLF